MDEYNFFLKHHPIKIADFILRYNKNDLDLNLYRNRLILLTYRHKENENTFTFYTHSNLSIRSVALLPIKGNHKFLSFDYKSNRIYLSMCLFDYLDIIKNNIDVKDQIKKISEYSKKLDDKSLSIPLDILKIYMRKIKLSKV